MGTGHMRDLAKRTRTRPMLAFLVLVASLVQVSAAAGQATGRPDFGAEPASGDARRIADWVAASGDNQGMPFVIVDKVAAKVFVFHPDGTLSGAAPVLLGLAPGDDSAPGIGERALADISPEQRTTPAGRFVAGRGVNLSGQDIVWVDYEAAISMHRVITSNAEERRVQRLATVSPLDNRISYGCINVPAEFYDSVVQAAFTGTNGVIYILPEVRPIEDVFSIDASDVSEPKPTAAKGVLGTG